MMSYLIVSADQCVDVTWNSMKKLISTDTGRCSSTTPNMESLELDNQYFLGAMWKLQKVQEHHIRKLRAAQDMAQRDTPFLPEQHQRAIKEHRHILGLLCHAGVALEMAARLARWKGDE